MSEDSNRNATASWSGFSHQGQVGILIALRELQKVGVQKEKTFVQFEKHEDVAIYVVKNSTKEYISVHQVKAYYSDGSDKKSKYSSVLNGDFESGDELYLHTVREITDWKSSTITNNNSVRRYEYSDGIFHSGTTEIENFIKEELKKLIGDNLGKIENAIKKITYELDTKVRLEHQKIKKELFNVEFSLTQIEAIINDENEFKAKEIYDCRKMFYNLYIESLKVSSLNDAEIEKIQTLVDEIYHSFLDDEFFLFIQRLSLSRNPEHLKSTQSVFNEDGLKQVFFKVLFGVKNVIPGLNKNDYTVIYSTYRYILTTIIDEKEDVKMVIQNILENLNSQKLFWEKTALINKEINGNFHELNPEFFDIRGKNQKMEDFKGFMQFNCSTSFICKETAKIKLTNEDTN